MIKCYVAVKKNEGVTLSSMYTKVGGQRRRDVIVYILLIAFYLDCPHEPELLVFTFCVVPLQH